MMSFWYQNYVFFYLFTIKHLKTEVITDSLLFNRFANGLQLKNIFLKVLHGMGYYYFACVTRVECLYQTIIVTKFMMLSKKASKPFL